MKILNRILSFMLCVGLLAGMSQSSLAYYDDPSAKNVFSESFLERARNSDGADSYAVHAEILNAYMQNPSEFLEGLMTLEGDDYDCFVGALVSSMYYDGDWEKFKSFLTSLADTNMIATAILQVADDFEKQELIWQEAYEDFVSNPAPEGLFSPEILTEAINAHADSYIYDQEFCGYLREMYELDQNLFVQTVEGFSNETLSQIAQQVSYAEYMNLGDVDSIREIANGTALSEDCLSASETLLKDSFSAAIDGFTSEAIAEAEKITSSVATSSTVQGTISVASTVTIGAMNYSNETSPPTQFEINKPMVLTTTISGLTANTQYKVELWARHASSSTENLKSTKTYTANSSGTIKASLNVTFSSPGEIWTTVKVYRGATQVASRTGGATDKIYARWRITLPLASNNYGTLTLYYASGAKAYSCTAFGQSASNAHYSKYMGNTPPGDYYGWTLDVSNDRVNYPEVSYGPYKVIKMVANTDPGYKNEYVNTENGSGKPRSGIWIHGGRSQDTYSATDGCVRIHNNDILNITNYMDSWVNSGYHARGRVSITR